MARKNVQKTVKLTKEGIDRLPNDKPVVYKIMNEQGKNIYTGVAKRGRIEDRLAEHLPRAKDKIPGGSKVQVTQKPSITEAQKSESRIVARSKPRHNKRGK